MAKVQKNFDAAGRADFLDVAVDMNQHLEDTEIVFYSDEDDEDDAQEYLTKEECMLLDRLADSLELSEAERDCPVTVLNKARVYIRAVREENNKLRAVLAAAPEDELTAEKTLEQNVFSPLTLE